MGDGAVAEGRAARRASGVCAVTWPWVKEGSAVTLAVIPLLCAVGLSAAGCADLMTSETLEQDVAQLRQDVSQLKLVVQRGRGEAEALGRLDRGSREQASENARQMAALSTRIENLAAEMARFSARLDQVPQRVEGRARPGPAVGVSPQRIEPPVPAPSPAPSASRQAPAGATSPTGGPTPEESYQAAYLDFTRGQYALAIPALRDYVRRFPDSPLADSAQYAVGESYFSMARASAAAGQADKSKQELEQAVREFRKVIVNYPRGSKVPTALYKEAVALTELRQPALAQARLQYLLDHFPQSEEAPLAKERLAALPR